MVRLGTVSILMAVTGVLLLVGVGVRGIRAEPPPRPEDQAGAADVLAEPLQLLARGGALRVAELKAALPEPAREPFDRAARQVFAIADCPLAVEWLDGAAGQDLERVIAELRRGEAPEALASLTLIVQLVRHTRWAPGFRGRIQHAERLAGLLQEWLRVWSGRAAESALLREPALAALLVYGRLMRVAYDEPTFGRNQAPYQRARSFVDELTGAELSRRTPFGDALASSYPRAFDLIVSSDDFLRGSAEEAKLLYPEIDGKCGQ
jgi:hypothetical protein